ncbi:MAG: hypothetical protein ABI151_04420 [Chitinophagaceae bacterium]
MKFSRLVIPVFSLVMLSACSGGGGKRISIMSTGKLKVNDQDTKNITLDAGTTHYEKEIYLPGSDKITISVKTPGGVKTFDADGDGLFLLNLQTDTLIGGMVNYSAVESTSQLTADDVDKMVDSTKALLLGKNASDANKTYWVIPFSIKKISNNHEAKLIGPYHPIPSSVSGGAGKTPEVYKFNTNMDKRATLEKLLLELKK